MDIYNKPFPQEYLAHYGVKGMKWGIRRTPEQLGHLKNTYRSKVQTASDHYQRAVNHVDKLHKSTKRRDKNEHSYQELQNKYIQEELDKLR